MRCSCKDISTEDVGEGCVSVCAKSVVEEGNWWGKKIREAVTYFQGNSRTLGKIILLVEFLAWL